MKRLLVLAAVCSAAVLGQEIQTPAQAKLQQVMRRAGAGGTSAAPAPPERMNERAALLVQGEAALARLDVSAALAAFDQAASIQHAADTEMGLVRAYMQGGEYRRALAFGAHTAGAHLDAVGGTALYAWLLHAGAQEVAAGRLLSLAHDRVPGQPLLSEAGTQLQEPWPRASGVLLQLPARLAPYGESAGLPANVQVVATATLARHGRAALVPAAVLAPGARYWVRDGLGRLSAAQPRSLSARHGLILMGLATPLHGQVPAMAHAPAFPGSIAYAVEYAPQHDGGAAWPLMKAGFVGPGIADGTLRGLGVGMPRGSPRGGPVFDAAGRLAGVAATGPDGDLLVPAALLLKSFGADLFDAPLAGPRLPPDAIYEPALGAALQLLRSAAAPPVSRY